MSDADFQRAAEDAKNLKSKPSDNDLLKLYGLYKRSLLNEDEFFVLFDVLLLLFLEATVGDNNTSKPGMLDMKGKYKWDAWNTNKGKSQGDAQQEYVAFVQQLKSK